MTIPEEPVSAIQGTALDQAKGSTVHAESLSLIIKILKLVIRVPVGVSVDQVDDGRTMEW